MKNLKLLCICLIILLSTHLTYSQGIDFKLANGQVTNDGTNDYYEFDIVAVATATSQFYIAQVYIDYNTIAFGSSIVANGKVTVTEGEMTTDVSVGSFASGGYGDYELSLADNSSSKLAVQNTHALTIFGSYSGSGYELSNTLSTTDKVYAHIKIQISDVSETCGLSLDDGISQFDQQQYYYTSVESDATAKYSPVTVSDGLNDPLPVELTYFTAELTDENVQLNWETATEVNNYGFDIERQFGVANSENPDTLEMSEWGKIGFAEGYGTSNLPKSYSFIDNNLPAANEVSYRLKQIDLDGTFSYSKVIVVDISTITSVEEEIPVEYSLSQNYPNPFNPATTIKFGLPETGFVDMRVYNILGEEVSRLIHGEMIAGYHTVNFGSNSIPSGIYIYTLNVEGKFSSVKKMLLIK